MRLGVDARVLAHRPTGVARYLRGLLAEWPASRQEGDTLFLYVDGEPQTPLPGEAEEVRLLRWPLPGGDPIWRQVRLAAHLGRHRPDVLFCPFYTIPLLTRVPAVVTIHDVSFLAHPEWFERKARLAFSLVRSSARQAERILTVSRFSAGEIERHLGVPQGRIEVVPPGIDRAWFEPVSQESREALRAWLGFSGRYLLHLGAVHERRRPDLLLRSFGRLAAADSELRLVIAGPEVAPPWPLRRRLTELGLGARVVRRQWIPEELIRALLAEATALAYLSVYEGFGLPALEALALGVPVVALRRASLPEVLGDAAVWVEREDAEEVADALRPLLEINEPVIQRAERGRRRASSFAWPAAARRVFALLRDAARRGQGPR